MIILGIDPGLAKIGYGIISVENGVPKAIALGCLRTPAGEKKEKRLCMIYDSVVEIIEKYKPDAMSLESLFFNKNTKTALAVGEARGIALLAAGKYSVPAYDYTPLQVKECLAGFGRAKKSQVAEIVKMELGLDAEIDEFPIDASDAMAIALCHYYKSLSKD